MRPTLRPMTPRRVRSILGACALLAVPALAGAQSTDDTPEDWPCVQRLVPEISLATLWPVPVEAALAERWDERPETVALARRLGDLESVDAATLAAIDAYAAAVPEPERRDALSRLAVGVVDVANARRSHYIDGIRRYTRKQIALAERVEGTLNSLAELDDAASPGTASGERAAVEETLAWNERVYDQREHAIRALCERPLVLEEMLSEVLRELAYRLPDA